MARGFITLGATIKDVLWAAQDGLCWICRTPMQKRGSNDPCSSSIDHIWPKATHGEIGDIGIVLLAHRQCNERRGSPQPSDEEIRALVRVWRAVDRRWLSWNIAAMEGEVRGLEVRKARVELLKMLEAA